MCHHSTAQHGADRKKVATQPASALTKHPHHTGKSGTHSLITRANVCNRFFGTTSLPTNASGGAWLPTSYDFSDGCAAEKSGATLLRCFCCGRRQKAANTACRIAVGFRDACIGWQPMGSHRKKVYS